MIFVACPELLSGPTHNNWRRTHDDGKCRRHEQPLVQRTLRLWNLAQELLGLFQPARFSHGWSLSSPSFAAATSTSGSDAPARRSSHAHASLPTSATGRMRRHQERHEPAGPSAEMSGSSDFHPTLVLGGIRLPPPTDRQTAATG